MSRFDSSHEPHVCFCTLEHVSRPVQETTAFPFLFVCVELRVSLDVCCTIAYCWISLPLLLPVHCSSSHILPCLEVNMPTGKLADTRCCLVLFILDDISRSMVPVRTVENTFLLCCLLGAGTAQLYLLCACRALAATG